MGINYQSLTSRELRMLITQLGKSNVYNEELMLVKAIRETKPLKSLFNISWRDVLIYSPIYLPFIVSKDEKLIIMACTDSKIDNNVIDKIVERYRTRLMARTSIVWLAVWMLIYNKMAGFLAFGCMAYWFFLGTIESIRYFYMVKRR